MPARSATGIAMTGLLWLRAAPTAAAATAPMRNWPWPPMLKRPALKQRPTERPTRIRGVAFDDRVDDAVDRQERSLDQGASRSRAGGPGRGGPVTSGLERMIDHGADDEGQRTVAGRQDASCARSAGDHADAAS